MKDKVPSPSRRSRGAQLSRSVAKTTAVTMPAPQGFATLQIPKDLLAKLRHDLARMKTDPDDVYAAFDFFVTAEHIVDWLYPDVKGTSQKAMREKMRSANRVLQITSHIANGAKHFVALAKQHTSVTQLEQKAGGFSAMAFSPRAFSPSAFQMSGLHVHLDDKSVVHAFTFAEEVLAYWEKELGA